MSKKIGIGLAAVLMVLGAVVFANNYYAGGNDGVCPNRPGCVCTK